MKHIIVPIDGSDGARHALDLALDLARCAHSQLTLMHVHPANAVELLGLVVQSRDELDAALRRIAGPIIAQAEETLRGAEVEAKIEVTIGDPAMEIVDYAAKVGADLIVMGSRGRSPLRAFLLGSVSARVIHHAGCSVTVVR